MLIASITDKTYQKACRRESEFRNGQDDYSFDIPQQVQEYENTMKYGKRDISDIDYLKQLGPFKKGLSLGAGGGTFELNLLEKNIVKFFHFIDISEGALNQLRKNAAERGLTDRITTEIQDINFISLDSDSYDFVSVINALHHVINLEELIYEVNKSLCSKGVFFTNDVIGESKMYRTDVRISAVNLFKSYMKDSHGLVIRDFIRTNPKVLTNNCPFECIRSHELESILQHYFNNTTIVHSTYWPLYFVWGGLINYKNISDDYLQTLQLFDSFIYKNSVCKPNRLLGIYRKSTAPLIYRKPRTYKEIKQNIGVSLVSERFLISLSNKIINRFPRLYNFLKKTYFKIR